MLSMRKVVRFGLGMSCLFHADMIDALDKCGSLFVLWCVLINRHRANRANARIKGCAMRSTYLRKADLDAERSEGRQSVLRVEMCMAHQLGDFPLPSLT